MALSFFGRKRPLEPKPADQEPAPVGSGDDSNEPLTELSALDFGQTGASQDPATSSVEIHVQEGGSGIGALFEEAAILYANGSAAEAEKVLHAALVENKVNAGEGLWLMLVDLYRLTGEREKFEQRVLDYATRFERSPPPWTDLSGRARAGASERVPSIGLSAVAGGQFEAQLGQLEVLARRSGAIRIDLARLRNLPDQSAVALLHKLEELTAARVKLTLANGKTLVEELRQKLAAGETDRREIWLLLLELLQFGGDQDRFEDLAVEYAVKFEESPPSWRGLEADDPQPVAAGEVEEVVRAGVLQLDGELCGATNEALQRITSLASEKGELKIDCDRLRRVDFVFAGMLFNVLATLQTQGKTVIFFNVNAMVAALLRVMSVDQVAHVTLRR